MVMHYSAIFSPSGVFTERSFPSISCLPFDKARLVRKSVGVEPSTAIVLWSASLKVRLRGIWACEWAEQQIEMDCLS